MAKRKQKSAEQKTHVVLLLDRTGSMAAIKNDTIGAFNSYIDTLKKDAADLIDFTFVQFDSVSIDKVCVATPIRDVKPLDDSGYQPRAWTPLIDAAYKTITATEEAVSKRADKPKVVVAIQTDGEENASKEHTWEQLNDLIKRLTAAGWQFLFMGAGLDAYKQGAKMGIAVASTLAYGMANSDSAFAAAASNTAQYAMGVRASTMYTAKQKFAAGDAFDPAGKPPKQKPVTARSAGKIVEDFNLDS